MVYHIVHTNLFKQTFPELAKTDGAFNHGQDYNHMHYAVRYNYT